MIINDSLNFIAGELNQHFKSSFNLSEDKVIVSNVVNHDGSIPIVFEDKVGITFINIESLETNGSKDLHLNILISSNFNDYQESLKFLSQVILFFKKSFEFTKVDYPGIGNNTTKISLELYKTDFEILKHFGLKAIPSINYKVQLLTTE